MNGVMYGNIQGGAFQRLEYETQTCISILFPWRCATQAGKDSLHAHTYKKAKK